MMHRVLAVAALLLTLAAASPAAQGRPDVAAQKAAMRKLAFLVGQWSGEASVTMGPGGPRALKQTEDVRYMLDGLVLLIEGTGRHPETAAVEYNALATVAFDEKTQTYRIRAYNGGNYLDTELTVRDRGVEWGYTAGPVTVKNTMTLDAGDRWVEVTDVSLNGGPPRRTVEIRVTK